MDPDSIRSVDPDPDFESGYGSRRAKSYPQIEKVEKFYVLKCWMFAFEC